MLKMAGAIFKAAKTLMIPPEIVEMRKKRVVTGSVDFSKPAIKPQFRLAWGDM
jgi:hypothetical protein